MVAERYSTYSSMSSRASAPPLSQSASSGVRSSTTRTVTTKYYDSSNDSSSAGGAPSIGRVRVTQSTDREARYNGYAPSVERQTPTQTNYAYQSYRSRECTPQDQSFSTSSSAGASSYSSNKYGARHFDLRPSPSPITFVPTPPPPPPYRRRYSFTADRIYHVDDSFNLDLGDDLDYETEQYLASEIYSSHGSARKGKYTRNHYPSPSVSDGPDFGSKKVPYVSPYRRVPSPITISQRASPAHGYFSSLPSPAGFIRRHGRSSRSSRAASMSRIETMESIFQNRMSEDVDRPFRHSSVRDRSISRVSVARGEIDPDMPVEPSSADDEAHLLRRQVRMSRRSLPRAASMSRVQDLQHSRGSVARDGKIHYAPRYPVSSITSPVDTFRPYIHVVRRPVDGKPRAASTSRVIYTAESPHAIHTAGSLHSIHTAGSPHGTYVTGSPHGIGSSYSVGSTHGISSAHGVACSHGVGSAHDIGSVHGMRSAHSHGRSSYTFSSPTDQNFTSFRNEVPTEKLFYGGLPATGEELDITRYVLKPGEKFLPTDVSVNILPTGKKAVTYTRFRQQGTGDQRQANILIDRIIQKTKRLQESLHTLEDFVKRNRSLFPEDIIIYQKIIFYLLDEDELKRLGYPPDAEVYGVKIREKLLAPYGSDVESILRRYYKRYKEVDIEYEDRATIRRKRNEVESETTVEDEEERRRRRRRRIDTEITEEEEEWMRRRRAAEKRGRLYIDEDELMSRPPSYRRRLPSEGPEPPQFTAKPRPRTVGLGEAVKFSCSVIGDPEPSLIWYHNNKQLFTGGRHQIDDRFIGSSTLLIRGVQKEDAGSYTARAVNPHGEVSYTTQLTVEEDELSRRKDALRRPWFIHEVHNTTTQVGQMITLDAQATGKPMPKFRWQRNNVDIPGDDDHIRVLSDGAGGTKLILRDVKTSDAGLYSCIAENDAGSTTCSATLRVGESFDLTEYYTLPTFGDLPSSRPPSRSTAGAPPLPFDLDEIIMKNWKNPCDFHLDHDGEEPARGKKPHFVQVPPAHITVMEGDPLTLRCVVDGEPRPLVKWYKGVRELTYTGRHRVLAERNGHHMMQVRQAMLTDPGEYTAVALNACGMVKYTTFVSVQPRSPEDDEGWTRPEYALREYEIIKKTASGKMAPIFIKRLPREKELLVGGTLQIECHVDEANMKEFLVGYGIVLKDANKNGATDGIHSNTPSTRNTDTFDQHSTKPEPVKNSNITPQSSSVTSVSAPAEQLNSSEGGRHENTEQIAAIEENNKITLQQINAETIPTQLPSQETNEQAVAPQDTAGLLTDTKVPSVKKEKVKKGTKSGKGNKSSAEISDQTQTATDMNGTNVSASKVENGTASEAGLHKHPLDSSTTPTTQLSNSVKVDTVTSQTASEPPVLPNKIEKTTAPSIPDVSFDSLSESESVDEEISLSAITAPVAASTGRVQVTEEPVTATVSISPAKFVSLLENRSATVGDSTNFHCSITGDSPFTITWLKDGADLHSNDRIKISNILDKDGGTCRLEISSTRREDGGNYSLRVANTGGEVSCTATLSVTDKPLPQIDVTFHDDEDEESDFSD